MSYFTAVRIYSIVELTLFAALIVFAVGGWSATAETVLGWSHGVGWLILCALVLYGALRGIFTWVVAALTVSPAGPLGSTNGIDYKGMRIDNKRIDEGDVFHLCDYELRFTYRAD